MLRADAHLGDILVAEVVNGVLVGEHHTTNRLVTRISPFSCFLSNV